MTDLRVERTHKNLNNAFMELLETRRFEDITVQELCKKAMVRRATFYSHFADKYEYLTFFMETLQSEFITAVNFRNSDIPAEAAADAFLGMQGSKKETDSIYMSLFQETINFLEQHPRMVQNIKNSQLLPALMDSLCHVIADNIYHHLNDTEPGDEIKARMKSAFLAGGLLALLRLWIDDEKSFDFSKVDWLG